MKPSWLNKSEYPFESHYLDINGHNMHYIDEGNGSILLFVHGTPSWSFDNRKLIKKLSKNFRCIAIDHLGFGLSDKPENYNYSTQQHAENLEFFIQSLDIESFTLVVHDFGGPIGLSYAIKHPEMVKNLVVFNTWLWSSESEPEYIKLKRILNSPFLPFLYLYLNFSARYLLPRSFGKQKPSKEIMRHYFKPFASKKERYGTLAFAKSLLNDQQWFEELWMNVKSISQKPTLFVWGMQDNFIGSKYLDKFKSEFANSEELKLENAGHFPQEEESEKVINALQNFLRRKQAVSIPSA